MFGVAELISAFLGKQSYGRNIAGEPAAADQGKNDYDYREPDHARAIFGPKQLSRLTDPSAKSPLWS